MSPITVFNLDGSVKPQQARKILRNVGDGYNGLIRYLSEFAIKDI